MYSLNVHGPGADNQRTRREAVNPNRQIDKLKDVQEALNEVVDLVTDSVRKTSVLGARALILGQFHNAAMPYLTKAQRLEVTRTFRVGVENAMSLTDDVALPAEYHSTLLDLTNSILRELEKEPAKRR